MNRDEKIEALRNIYRDCAADPRFDKLRSHHPPKRVVPGRGSMDPLVVMVGEAPGEREQDTRRPFQGPAGKVLDDQLASVGLQRRELFITNAIKFRPTIGMNVIKNRAPNTNECNAARPYLFRELDLFLGVPVVALGKTAMRCLRPPRDEVLQIKKYNEGHPVMGDLHGTGWTGEDGREYFCLYHPAVGCYDKPMLNVMLTDMATMKAWLDGIRDMHRR